PASPPVQRHRYDDIGFQILEAPLLMQCPQLTEHFRQSFARYIFQPEDDLPQEVRIGTQTHHALEVEGLIPTGRTPTFRQDDVGPGRSGAAWTARGGIGC